MRRIGAGLVAVALALGACGGDDGDEDTGLEEVGDDAGDDAGDDSAPAGALEGGLPFSVGLFGDLCSGTIDAFEGAAGYDPSAPGVHPLVLLEERSFDENTYSQASGSDYPEDWLVEDDTDFEDNSELAAVELVGCAARSTETPNGTECEFDDDGDTITIELVDVTYVVTLYEAATGEVVVTRNLEAQGTECPFSVFLDEGQEQVFNTPAPEDYVAALSEFVET